MKTQDNDRQWRAVALSFAAGAASMSLIMYARDKRKRRRQQHQSHRKDTPDPSATTENTEDNIDANANKSMQALSHKDHVLLHKSSSFIDTVCQSVEDAVEDIKSRIGELPGRRSHWPWESIHRRNSFAKKDKTPEPDTSMKLAPDPSEDIKADPELCIGSIFGLDVGGTLAKLVYFEQRPDQDNSCNNCSVNGGGLREKHYYKAASAQAVLKARRGHDLTDAAAAAAAAVAQPPTLQSNATLGGHETSKGRFSGLLRRKLSSSSPELDQQAKGINNNKARRRSSSKKEVHTSDSNDDLENMYMLRQESVPDDLDAFATSVHYNDIPLYTHKRSNSHDNPTSPSMCDATVSSSPSKENNQNGVSRGTPINATMKKSRSMFDLSVSQKSKDRAEALDRFYHFARKLDSYREGVKDHKLSFYSRKLGGEFHFIRFETRRMENAMELIRANNLHLTIREMGATGGGAHKFANDWEQKLGIQMKKTEELDSLVAGMQFVLSTVVGECYTYRPRLIKETGAEANKNKNTNETPTNCSISSSVRSAPSSDASPGGCVEEEKKFQSPFASDESDSEDSEGGGHPVGSNLWNWSRKAQRDSISYDSSTYPYLLVTIGTGVSILRVDGPRKHERISGSTIGGGTYWGLIRLLTDVEDFEDVMRLAKSGDPTKCDMMVGDIYGNNPEALEKLGLPADLVASSFGKLVSKEDPAAGLTDKDLARALLLMVTNNIGQVAYLNAQLHKTSRIFFVGNFLRGNTLSQRRLSYAIDYWSKGEMEALFLEHEGYFGALGAFLLSQDISLNDLGPDRSQNRVPQSHSFRNHRRSQTMGGQEL